MTDKAAGIFLTVVLRWGLKIVSGILAVISIIFIADKGMPDPYLLKMEEALNLTGLIIIITGVILAWVWAFIGGVIIILGFLLILAVSFIYGVIIPDIINIFYFIIGLLFIISGKSRTRDTS
jgi:hypothetical protein